MIYVNTDIGYHFQLWFCKVIQRSPYNHLQNHAGSEEKMAAAPGYGTVLNLDNLPKNDPQKDNGDHVAKYGVCVCVCVCVCVICSRKNKMSEGTLSTFSP